MRTILQQIYAVQQIDIRLDELDELKGDLPGEVARLRNEVETRETAIAEYQATIKKAMVQRDETDGEIASLKDKIEKYREQQLSVKTNKQYDSLTKEVENSQIAIQQLEKGFQDLETSANKGKVDTEKLSAELPELKDDLKRLEKDLHEVSAESANEEEALREERKKAIEGISESDMQMYERIRKAKGGKAVVAVRIREEGKTKKIREASCGGCHHRIPPERMSQLRGLEKMFTCEHCGRILVPNEITEPSQPVAVVTE